VRGINLGGNDRIISMTIVGHVDAEPWERAAYLKRTATERRLATGDAEEISLVGEEVTEEGQLSDDRYEELKAREQFVLTVSEKGYGKRSSSYDFRISGRGGKGIRATDTSKTSEIGALVAAFPVDDGDQIMLVSDGGQLIRVPVGGIRIASRATKGVTIFSTAKDEKVVSVERISEPEEEAEDTVENGDDAAPNADHITPAVGDEAPEAEA
jgi:DNA gyrase subunit A